MNPRVLLTGATGFLGSRVAPRLVRAGFRLHAIARPSADRSALEDLGVVWHIADLEDPASIELALLAARAEAGGEPLDVVHCGAVISYRSCDRVLQQCVNVEGTRHIIEAAKLHGVRRLLHVSSVVTVGHALAGEVLDESFSYNGQSLRVDYVDTKRAAEELVFQASGDLDVVVVNPSAIFGVVGPHSNSAYFLQRVADGRVRVAPPGTVGVVGVDDTADGVVVALERGRAGARYLLSESWLSLRDLLELVARQCGVPGPSFSVPPLAWRGLGLAATSFELLKPLERLTPQSIRMVGAHFRAHAGLAREELDWKPRPIREVLGETLSELGLVKNPTGGGA